MTGWQAGKVMKNPEDWVRAEELNLILDKAQTHSHRNWLILFLLFRTGRRIGELLQLKAKDISFERKMVLWNIEKKHKRLKDSSGNFIRYEKILKDGTVRKAYQTEKIDYRVWKPLDSVACEYLKRYVEGNDFSGEDYIFYSPVAGKHKPLSRITVWLFLSKYAKELNINIHPHSFRHAFSISVAENIKTPADLKKLSMHLEHSSIQVTEGYLQFAPEETRDLLERTFNEYVTDFCLKEPNRAEAFL